MSNRKIVSHAGLTIDISQVKCFKLSSVSKNKMQVLSIEFKTRHGGYIRNPLSEGYEKLEFNDSIKVMYRNPESAKKDLKEWEQIWEAYINWL